MPRKSQINRIGIPQLFHRGWNDGPIHCKSLYTNVHIGAGFICQRSRKHYACKTKFLTLGTLWLANWRSSASIKPPKIPINGDGTARTPMGVNNEMNSAKFSPHM